MNLAALVRWPGIEAVDSFLQTVRQLHHSGVKTLVMTRVDFEQLTLFWPEFYLSGPTPQPRKDRWLWRILRKVFKKPKPVTKMRLSDQMIESLRTRFRNEEAIPVDGRWFPVKFWEEMCEGHIGESRQGTREDVHKY